MIALESSINIDSADMKDVLNAVSCSESSGEIDVAAALNFEDLELNDSEDPLRASELSQVMKELSKTDTVKATPDDD